MKTLCCPITGINIPRFLITLIVSFGFVFGYEYLLHGKLLMPTYEATKDVWRTMEEMQQNFKWMTITQGLFALTFCFIFARFAQYTCLMKSAFFGLCLGALAGIPSLGAYVYLPIPMDLAISWLAGYAIEGLGLGIICGLLYRQGSSCCDKNKTSCSTEKPKSECCNKEKNC